MKSGAKKNDIVQQRAERALRQRRGERTLQILEFLSQGAALTIALMCAFAPGTTRSMANNLRKLPKDIQEFFDDKRTKNKFYCLLSYLQKSGLVTKNDKSGRMRWLITKKGQEKRNELHRKIAQFNAPRLVMPKYLLKKSNSLVVVIFDIPEKEKFKRDWFRSVLRNLGFSLIQKSVWMGHVQIPQELVRDLKKFNIFSFIKIFSVVEIGNLD